MTRLTLLIMCLFFGSVSIGLSGCGDDQPPEKTTNEKLNSDNPAEQAEGLDEAAEKWGDQ